MKIRLLCNELSTASLLVVLSLQISGKISRLSTKIKMKVDSTFPSLHLSLYTCSKFEDSL